MAGANFQVSSKLNDGRIFVIGADTFADFKSNLVEVLGVDGAEEQLLQWLLLLREHLFQYNRQLIT